MVLAYNVGLKYIATYNNQQLTLRNAHVALLTLGVAGLTCGRCIQVDLIYMM